MLKSTSPGRVLAVAGLLACTLALPTQAADASSIYACVNKHSGSARIVGAKTKCRRGERKDSWSTTGPAGAAGAAGTPGSPGAAGSNGANGVGSDFASLAEGVTELGAGSGAIVVARTIPAGSYFVSANTVVGAAKAKSAVFVIVVCELIDTAGTPAFVEPPDAIDIGEWAQALGAEVGGEFGAASTTEMQGQLTTTTPTTLAVMCAPIVGGKEATFDAVASQINALQTTANR